MFYEIAALLADLGRLNMENMLQTGDFDLYDDPESGQLIERLCNVTLSSYSGCHCERSEAIPKPQGGDCFVAKNAPTQKLDV